MEPKSEIVRWKGRLYQTPLEPEEAPKPLPGSALGFSINGEWQGVAYHDLLEGTYYAAASLFTKPKPDNPAAATFRFGPDFKFAPPHPDGFAEAQPFSAVQAMPSVLDTGVTIVTAEQLQADVSGVHGLAPSVGSAPN